MSKEAEEFFRQKTIENAKRPRMKKFLALVNREAEGKIMQEYADQQLRLYDVSQQRKLLFCECLNNFDIYQETKIYHTSCNKEVKIIRTK
jgi:hypothetical protein